MPEKAYERLQNFLQNNYQQLVTEFRNSPDRPNSLGIEVRKDFVWEFSDEKCRFPIAPKVENAALVAEILAKAIMIYFTEDKTCESKIYK